MPKPKTSSSDFAELFITVSSSIGGLVSFGYFLYVLYHFLPVWFESLFSFVLFTPFIALFMGIFIKFGMFAGIVCGISLYIIYACVISFCSFCKTVLLKLSAKPIPKTPTNPTTKDKIELIVGFVGLSYTALLIGVAMFSSVPKDDVFCIWLILSAIVSCVGNRQLKKIQSQP